MSRLYLVFAILYVFCVEAIGQNDTSRAEVFTVVEQQPQFEGGYAALLDYINSNKRYPKDLRKSGIEGIVEVEFTVDKDGSITNVAVAKGLHPLLDAEAERVVKAMPEWIPGRQQGKPVTARFRLPIKFKPGR